MATREQKHAYSERSWDKRIKREDYQDEVFSYNKSRFGKRKERDAYNDSRFEKQKERDAYNDKAFAKKVRREKYSTAVSYFLVIVLVGGIFLSSGFLSDLETFIPTETKTTYKDTNVVKYEVASNWDNATVLNVGKSAMNVFNQVGSFLGSVGSASQTAFSLINGVLSGTLDEVVSDLFTVTVPDKFSSVTCFSVDSVMSNEREFWCLYCTLSGTDDDYYLYYLHDTSFVPGGAGTPSATIKDYYYFVNTDYLDVYSSRVSWWNRNIRSFFLDLLNDYKDCPRYVFVSPSDFSKVKQILASEEET